jgi:hypothetical protein
MTKREDLRLQGHTGSKTGGDQSEKGNKKRAHRDTTRISRMLGTTAFSARTEFSVTTTEMTAVGSPRSHLLTLIARLLMSSTKTGKWLALYLWRK